MDVVPARRAVIIASDTLSIFQRSVVHTELRTKELHALPLRWPGEPLNGVIRLDTGPAGEPFTVFAQEVRSIFGAAGLRKTLR